MGSLVGICGEGPLQDQARSMMTAMRGRVAGAPRIDAADGCALGTHTRSLGAAHLRGFQDGDYLVAGDARIDTRRALARELGLAEDASAEAVIVAGWKRWGHGLWARLRGDFAIAIWDRQRRRLVVARDPFGVRPAFYHEREGRFALGSEVKAILALPWTQRKLNEERVRLYLENRHEGWETFYAGIHHLPPGRFLEWERGNLTIDRYWRWSDVKENKKAEMEESARELRRLLEQAVARRLEARTNACFFLSGGWDSSTLVTLAARQGFAERARMETGTFVFDNVPECDEREYARAVRDACGLKGFEVDGSKLSPLDGLEEMLAIQDEPWCGPNLFLHDAVYEEAAARGYDATVDGIDGDTVISHGWGYLGDLLITGRVPTLLRRLGELVTAGLTTPWNGVRIALRPLVPNVLVRLERRVRLGGREVVRLEKPLSAAARPPKREHALHAWMLEREGLSLALEAADRIACRRGLEPLYPFLDVDVARHALSLPGQLKLGSSRTRAVLARSIAETVPAAVSARKTKSNLGANFSRSLGAMRVPVLRRLLNEANMGLRPFGRLDDVVENPRRSSTEWIQVWVAVLLGRWLWNGPCKRSGDVV